MSVHRLSKTQQHSLLEAAKRNGGTISSREYRLITAPKNTVLKKYDFNFKFDSGKFIADADNSVYVFSLLGRHLSVNSLASLPFKQKLRYKRALKDAAKIYFATDGKQLIPPRPHSKVILHSTFFNPRKRDDDANAGTLKILRDLFVIYKFAVDDNRDIFEQTHPTEVISKQWKVVLELEVV